MSKTNKVIFVFIFYFIAFWLCFIIKYLKNFRNETKIKSDVFITIYNLFRMGLFIWTTDKEKWIGRMFPYKSFLEETLMDFWPNLIFEYKFPLHKLSIKLINFPQNSPASFSIIIDLSTFLHSFPFICLNRLIFLLFLILYGNSLNFWIFFLHFHVLHIYSDNFPQFNEFLHVF